MRKELAETTSLHPAIPDLEPSDRYGTMDRRLEALECERLLHEDQALIGTVTWADWFPALGSSTKATGRGVALGWAHLADGLVGAGIFARVWTLSYRTGRRFWVV